jgi:hypothetical protein
MWQGLRHGAGTFYYADGSRYCGQWEDNVKCGYGVHTHPDGGVSEGIFKLDRLVRDLMLTDVQFDEDCICSRSVTCFVNDLALERCLNPLDSCCERQLRLTAPC